MDHATIALISALIGLLVKYEPEIAALGKEIILIFEKGNALTPEDIASIQAYTDQIGAKVDAAIAANLAENGDTGL